MVICDGEIVIMQYKNVDYESTIITQPLPDGYYACTENNGNVTIRDLKTEALEWEDSRERILHLRDYPYCRHYNWQYTEMYHWGESEPFKCDYEKLDCYLKQGDVVVDIGANVGMFTRLALEKGAKEVHAFEPSEDAYKCLLINASDDRVKSYRACLHNYNGWVEIGVNEYPMATAMSDSMGDSKRETVPCLCLIHI